MLNKPLILAIDCGTQSIRTLLFDKNGNILGKVKKVYSPIYLSPKPGWAEQEAEIYWQYLCDCCKKLQQCNEDHFNNIAAVSITTQRDTCILVDKDGKPLRNAILWLDQRKALPKSRFGPLYRLALKSTNMKEDVDNYSRDFKANWIKENEQEVWNKTHKYLLLSGYLHYKLTGSFTDGSAYQIGHIPFDYKRKKWASLNDIKSRVFDIEREKLPNLVPASQIIGHITKKAADLTAIKQGIPVIASGSDKGCETLGSGCIDTSVGCISLGSTATIQTTSRKYFELTSLQPSYPAIVTDCYNPEIQIYRGYWMISWFKNEFAKKECQLAENLGVSPEAILNDELTKIPPGSHGLMLQPFWGPPLKKPEAKGAIIGFGDVHTRAHVYKAIIEGIAYALLDGSHHIQKKTGIRMEYIVASGGGSQSNEICQLSADIFNRPVKRVQTFETSGLGAAIAGFVGLGIYKDYQIAVKNMVHYKDTFIPNYENVKVYSRLYREVYKNIYSKLRPLYKRIREITNYPEKR